VPPPRIILVRHGPSAYVEKHGVVDHAGVYKWRDGYDAAGILASAQPPPALSDLAANAQHIVASDLRRAIESAERLAARREIRVTELLREAPLALPRWPTRLPVMAWGLMAYASWKIQLRRGIDPLESDTARAGTAADWLVDMVSDGSTAVVVTHGVFRWLLANQLLSRGWNDARREGGYQHWSAWRFSPEERAIRRRT
jgi:broad specificity phosphatase PhoE